MGEIKKGLKGVVVADSEICKVDGEKGILYYRGYNINDFAGKASYEEVVYLLLFKKWPNKRELGRLKTQLAKERDLPGAVWKTLQTLSKKGTPMGALRTIVSELSAFDKKADDNNEKENIRKAVSLIAKFPTIVGNYYRIKHGKSIVKPNKNLSHAGNFLYMLNGKKPDSLSEQVFDLCLVLHAEHGFNASTFSGRVTISTLSDFYSAITSAIGTLKGPLHGGANTAVMQMLKEIKNVKHVEQYTKGKLRRHELIMGFGHRVYRVLDPRAAILRETSHKLGEHDSRWIDISEAVYEVVHNEKGLWPNVDFFSASTYHYLGIPVEIYTPIFAISRVSGWSAHILEQLADNKLIRPLSRYTGKLNLRFTPLEKR